MASDTAAEISVATIAKGNPSVAREGRGGVQSRGGCAPLIPLQGTDLKEEGAGAETPGFSAALGRGAVLLCTQDLAPPPSPSRSISIKNILLPWKLAHSLTSPPAPGATLNIDQDPPPLLGEGRPLHPTMHWGGEEGTPNTSPIMPRENPSIRETPPRQPALSP